MNRTLIYIHGVLMDLLPGTVIASTFKALEIGDLRTRNSNYTNQFRLPKTANNKQVLEHADLIGSSTGKPYTKLPAKVVQQGIEIIPRGIAYIESCEEHFNVSIHAGSFGFFDAVGEQSLIELDMSDNDFGSSNNIVEVPFVANEPYDETTNPLEFSNVGYSVPYKDVIEKIISAAGYSKTGDVFSDGRLGAIHLAALGLKGYNNRFTAPKEFEAMLDTSFVLNASSTPTKINFTNVVKNPSGWYDGTNTYEVQDPQGGAFGGTWFQFNVYATLRISVVLAGGASGIDIELFSNTGVHTLEGVGSGDYQFELSERMGNGPVSGIEATEVYMTIRTTLGVGTATVTFTLGHIYNTILREIAPIGNVLPLQYVNIQGILPDYPQRELLRHFMIAFGAFFRESAADTLEVKTLTEIITDRANAVDWTNKRDRTHQEKLNYALNNYAQSNRFRYSSNDDLANEETGQGTLDVGNENIEDERDFYTSDFNATATLRVGNENGGFITCAKIPIDPAEAEDPGLRLLLVRDEYDYEPSLAGSVSSYKVGYFEDALAPYSLNWQTFIDEHYPELAEYLQKAKVVTRYYNLSPLDIASLDLFKLVYDSGAYFLINTVENYVPGQPTKVELFKVS